MEALYKGTFYHIQCDRILKVLSAASVQRVATLQVVYSSLISPLRDCTSSALVPTGKMSYSTSNDSDVGHSESRSAAPALYIPSPAKDEISSNVRDLHLIDDGPHVAILPRTEWCLAIAFWARNRELRASLAGF